MKKGILIILITILGCEEAFDYEPSSPDDLLVVEALLTNEKKSQEVQLSKTYRGLNDTPPPVRNAIVALNDGESTIILQHDPTRPGTYMTEPLQALFGKLYTLYIYHEGKEYFAQATSTFGTPLEPLNYQELESGWYEFIYSGSDQPSMTEVIISWSTDNEGQQVSEIREAFYYSLNVLDISTVFAPEKEPLVFPPGAQIFRRKYSLTDPHQEFLRSFLAEVDWRGGVFDVSPGNVSTNLSEGAVGYFSVSMVQSDLTIVDSN